MRRGRTGGRQSGRAVEVPERRGGTPAMTRNGRLPARLARSKRESNSCRCRALELTLTRRSSICCRLGRWRILSPAAVTVDHGVLSAVVEICSVPCQDGETHVPADNLSFFRQAGAGSALVFIARIAPLVVDLALPQARDHGCRGPASQLLDSDAKRKCAKN